MEMCTLVTFWMMNFMDRGAGAGMLLSLSLVSNKSTIFGGLFWHVCLHRTHMHLLTPHLTCLCSNDGSSYQGEFRYGKRHGSGVSFSKGSTVSQHICQQF